MAFVRLADIDDLEGTARDIANSGVAQYGRVLNTWRAIMNEPDIFAAYLPFVRAVAGPGPLDPVLKDLVALYVGYLNNCVYTTSHRATSATAKGVSDETMRLVVGGQWESLDEALRVALTLARELTLLPPQVAYEELPQGAQPETLALVRDIFDDREILSLTMSIGLWNALSRFHRVMGLELDMPAAPRGVRPR